RGARTGPGPPLRRHLQPSGIAEVDPAAAPLRPGHPALDGLPVASKDDLRVIWRKSLADHHCAMFGQIADPHGNAGISVFNGGRQDDVRALRSPLIGTHGAPPPQTFESSRASTTVSVIRFASLIVSVPPGDCAATWTLKP